MHDSGGVDVERKRLNTVSREKKRKTRLNTMSVLIAIHV